MDELDLFRNFRGGVAAPSPDAQRRASARLTNALEEPTGREQAARPHHGSRRRLIVLAAAVLVVVVATASAFGTVRDLFGNGNTHVARNFFTSEGKRGSFGIRILTTRPTPYEQVRSWRMVPEPEGSSVPTTGQYVQVTGRGRIVRIGGHAQAWSARLEGFVARPGEAKQPVVITMKGRPTGVFVLTPLQPGFLKRDSGTQTYTHATG
jgi:hypothetical protein